MDFVVLLSVIAITVSQVVARSIDTDGSKTKGSGEIEEFEFMLPISLRHSFKMTINGKLDRSHENFLVKFLPKGGNETDACTLNFNYKKNKFIEVTPNVNPETDDDENYSIYHNNSETDFKLSIEAKDFHEGHQMLDLRFRDVNSDPGPLLTCKVASFDELNHILFKEGVKKIDSILFDFTEMETRK